MIRDCAENRNLISIPTGSSLIIGLVDNLILKIELVHYSFTEMEIPSKGIPYLNHALREQFTNDLARKEMRNQPFVFLPFTQLSEGLDLRGPQGLSAEEVNNKFSK